MNNFIEKIENCYEYTVKDTRKLNKSYKEICYNAAFINNHIRTNIEDVKDGNKFKAPDKQDEVFNTVKEADKSREEFTAIKPFIIDKIHTDNNRKKAISRALENRNLKYMTPSISFS